MPQLPENMHEAANEAASASRDFKPLEEGVYTARLSKVDAAQTQGKPSKAMWKLEFDQVRDWQGNNHPGRLWSNITIEESTMWKVAQFFAAFTVPTSTHTDELINYRCRLDVSKRVQAVGRNAGKEVNEVRRYSPLDEGDAGFEAVTKLGATLGAGKPAAAVKAPAASSEPSSPVAELAESDEVDF